MGNHLGIIPKQSRLYLIICVAGILAFVAVGIYPSKRQLKDLDGRIAELRAQIEEQKVLFPVYQEIVGRIEKSKAAIGPRASKRGLSQNQIDKVSTILKELVQQHRFQALSVTPDVKSLANDSKLLLVHLLITGELSNFRPLLMDLEDLPYLDRIEQIQVRESDKGKEFGLKIWLMVSAK